MTMIQDGHSSERDLARVAFDPVRRPRYHHPGSTDTAQKSPHLSPSVRLRADRVSAGADA